MSQPPGYIQRDGSLVCRLKNAICGLKQALRAWFQKLHSFLTSIGL